MKTAELEIVEESTPLRLAVAKEAPDFEEIILRRKKLLKKVEDFDPVEDVNDTVRMEEADRLRLDLVKCRTGLESIRKAVGEKARKHVEAVNEMFRGYREENESAEAFLKESADFGANYEKARKAQLKAEREPLLRPYVPDTTLYALGDMTEAQFDLTLKGAKAAHEAALKEQEEQRRKEQAEREKDRLEAEKARAELAKEREAQRVKDAEALRQRQESDKKLAEERRQKEALEQKERERQAAEARKAEEEKKAAAKAARAPDKQKVLNMAGLLEKFTEISLPNVKSDEAAGIVIWTTAELSRLVASIRRKAENL